MVRGYIGKEIVIVDCGGGARKFGQYGIDICSIRASRGYNGKSLLDAFATRMIWPF